MVRAKTYGRNFHVTTADLRYFVAGSGLVAGGTEVAIAQIYGVSGQVKGDRVGDFQSPISRGVSSVNLMAGTAIYWLRIFDCRTK